MHVHCLHWLKSTGLLYLNAFADRVNPRLVKWRQRRDPIWLWGPDMAPTINTRLSRPCSGILVLVGASTRHSYSELYYLCLISSLFKLLPPHTPTPHPSCPPLIYTGPCNINEFHQKIIKNWRKSAISNLSG